MARALRDPDAKAVTPLTDEQEELYRAYSAGYGSVGAHRLVEFVVDLLFALVALAIVGSSIFEFAEGAREATSRWTPFVALTWLGLRELRLLGDPGGQRMEAVRIQEQFDLTFWKGQEWGEVWNSLLCDSPVPARTIKELAARFDGESIDATYWADTEGLPPAAAALVRIQQSAGWGERAHRRYAALNTAASFAGVVLVLGVGAIGGLDTLDMAAATMAIAPPLTGRLAVARSHRDLSESRSALEAHVVELLLDVSSAPTDQDVRSAQDELVRLRLENRRIPVWLYQRYRAKDQETIDASVDDLAGKLRKQYVP